MFMVGSWVFRSILHPIYHRGIMRGPINHRRLF
jgi:hypothetical protein